MLEKLTEWEYSVAELSALGATQKEVAYALDVNVCKVNNTMRVVHQKLGTDEHSLPRVFLGEKYQIADIAEPLKRYSFLPSPKLQIKVMTAIVLILSLEFAHADVLRVRTTRARRSRTEYVFALDVEN